MKNKVFNHVSFMGTISLVLYCLVHAAEATKNIDIVDYEKEKFRTPPLLLSESLSAKHTLLELEKPLSEFRLPLRSEKKRGLSVAKEQGPLGLCTSFSVGACIEFFYPSITVSEADFTIRVEKSTRDYSCDGKAGLTLKAGMDEAAENGFIKETYSYRDYVNALAKFHKLDPKTVWNLRGKEGELLNSDVRDNFEYSRKGDFKFTEVGTIFPRARTHIFNWIEKKVEREENEKFEDIKSFSDSEDRVDAIKRILSGKQIPVAVSVPVWWKSEGIDAGWEFEAGGIVKTPTINKELKKWFVKLDLKNESNTPEKKQGWHVIVLGGYRDGNNGEGVFDFKNSWGNTWGKSWGDTKGEKGFGTIPYSYIRQFSDIAMWGDVKKI